MDITTPATTAAEGGIVVTGPMEPVLVITNQEGPILRLDMDGKLTLKIEDATEAAQLFVAEVKRLWSQFGASQA